MNLDPYVAMPLGLLLVLATAMCMVRICNQPRVISPEKKLRLMAHDVLPVISAVCDGFHPDPGTSDLDDEQPVHVRMTLGDYRRACRLRHELDEVLR